MDGLMKLSYLIFACMIVACPITANAALTCTTVKGILKPCYTYFLTQGRPFTPGPVCCSGVRNLNGRALTPLVRRQVCRCIQSAAKGAGRRFNADRAAKLPMACGFKTPYKISTSTNCNTLR